MNYIKISNIFNYLPNAIRRQMNDDKLIESWSLQAYRKVHFRDIQYMRNIHFMEISSHEGTLPSDFLHVHKVSILGDPDAGSLVDLYDCPECDALREDNRDAPCPLTHRYFLNSAFYGSSSWEVMKPVSTLSDDFFCKAPALSCKKLYFLKNGKIYSSVSSGLMALDYYSFRKDDDGDFVLPEMPVVMWEYLAKHVEVKFLEERTLSAINETGMDAFRRRNFTYSASKQSKAEEVSLLNNWRAMLTLSNLSLTNHKHLQSGALITSMDSLRNYLTTYYGL